VARGEILVTPPPPVTDPAFPVQDRQAELAAAERAIAEALPEDDGYVSPWEVKPLDPSVKWHYQWRTARGQFAATGSLEAMDSMLAYVTADNPPMRYQEALQRHQRAVRRMLPIMTWAVRAVVFLACVGALAVILGLLTGLFIGLVPLACTLV
jgi:hypothetical protein